MFFDEFIIQPFAEALPMHLLVIAWGLLGLLFYGVCLLLYVRKPTLRQVTLSRLGGYVFPALWNMLFFTVFHWYIALPLALFFCWPFSRFYAQETLYLLYYREHEEVSRYTCQSHEQLQKARERWRQALATRRGSKQYKNACQALLIRFGILTGAEYGLFLLLVLLLPVHYEF